MLFRYYYSSSIWKPLKVCMPHTNGKYMLMILRFKCTVSMRVY